MSKLTSQLNKFSLTGEHKYKTKPRIAAAVTLVILAAVTLPIASLAIIAVNGDLAEWPHLARHVLPAATKDTAILLTITAIITITIGFITAWITTFREFPARKFFEWALILPLSIPTYIAAYAMVEVFDYTGPIQTIIRYVIGAQAGEYYDFINIRSPQGAAVTLSLVLYPYVYVATKIGLAAQGGTITEASRSLGANSWKTFARIDAPLARPAIAAGVALVLMETINDIGAAEYMGVRTITLAVFETWLNRDNLESAVQLSLLLLIVVAALVTVERYARNKITTKINQKQNTRLNLSKPKQIIATMFCSVILFAGFGIPTTVLGIYALRRPELFVETQMLIATANSLVVATLTASVTLVVAFFVLSAGRSYQTPKLIAIGRVASLGYAIPGTVLAIGLLFPLTKFDNSIGQVINYWIGNSQGLLLSGSLFILVYACAVRFLVQAWSQIETGFTNLSPNIDMAARGLGRPPTQLAFLIHIPASKPAIAAAALLVFVETTKELSATLLLRPLGFETLATFIYARASQSDVEQTGAAAFAIIILGLMPLVLLTKKTNSNKKHLNRKHSDRKLREIPKQI